MDRRQTGRCNNSVPALPGRLSGGSLRRACRLASFVRRQGPAQGGGAEVKQIIAFALLTGLLSGCGGASRARPTADAATSSCTAPANQPCEGCSVTCQDGQHAMCQAGQLTSGDNPACWNLAKCECQ